MKKEKVLGELLKEKGKTVAAAESFTGGLFGKRITDIPGSSNYFLGSVVAYSYTAKERILKIDKRVLKENGAVSRETAKLMADNIRDLLDADFGVSFTGVAGPDKQEGKPVGLAFIGISEKRRTTVYQKNFSGSREEIREKAVNFAIETLINLIGGK